MMEQKSIWVMTKLAPTLTRVVIAHVYKFLGKYMLTVKLCILPYYVHFLNLIMNAKMINL